MTKEQEIYKNMKMNHRIWKSHGKYGINYENLYCAIRDAGYDDHDTIIKIIKSMVNQGYIYKSHGTGGKYIITKWVN